MNKNITILIVMLLAINLSFAASKKKQPNVLIIYADDLGYGDVSCFNPESKVQTPNIDRLAKEGVIFTDAHSASTVCSPSRYSLLTGRMEFRTGFKGTFSSVQGGCLIEEDRLTIPQMLSESGYATGMVGKWHLGMTFTNKKGENVWTAAPFYGERYEASNPELEQKRVMSIDFNRPIPDGPINRGFDYFFGTAGCPTTQWMYAYIEGNTVPVPPQKAVAADKFQRDEYSKIRPGMIAPDYDIEEMDMVLLKKSQDYINAHVKKSPEQPFFLYHSAQAIHLPSIPGKDFRGKTKAGPHGDFILELDYVVGELMKTLKENDILDNTLVIITSDNGPERLPTAAMARDYDHNSSGGWRGIKREQWEGGHRVPFVAYWPNQMKGGGVCDQPISQTDIMASLAAIVGYDLPDNSAEDSYDFSKVFLSGKDTRKPIRPFILHQTVSLKLAVRKGKWKYLDHRGNGVNRNKKPKITTGPPAQLYDLENDPEEKVNLYDKHPEVVKELKSILIETQKSGRSRF